MNPTKFRKYKWDRWIPPVAKMKNAEMEDDEIFEEDEAGIKYIGRMFFTHAGIYSLSEHEYSHEIFDFWYLNTNFDLNEEILRIIDGVPGVETHFPVTRYKTKVGFPKSGLFDSAKCQQLIEQNIEKHCIYNESNLALSELLQCDISLIDNIISSYNHLENSGSIWFMYVFPNGEIVRRVYDELSEQFHTDYKLYAEINTNIGGYLTSFIDKNHSKINMV